MRQLGAACYAVAAFALVAALLGVVIGPDWIERLTGASPDRGDGSLELAWVVVPLVVAAGTAVAGWCLRGQRA
ncbi:MAG: hypothetical protein QOI98_848 [Solirubrobacteraceae bacterium]|jgi:hypothetical protein|nr:hypothetical protein [Solirubrobacteraceae bacterium]